MATRRKPFDPDEIAAMAVFACVVERGSLSSAADALGTSKSFVSKTLRALEERLATRLLQRTTRRQTLTEAGLAYYDGCRTTLDAAARARSAVERLQHGPVGQLRLSTPVNFGNLYIAPLLPKLLEAHPELSVDMVLSDRVVDLVGEGFDLALRIADQLDDQLVARPIATIRWAFCASPAYLSRRGTPSRPEMLAHHHCLTHPQLNVENSWTFVVNGKPLQVRVDGPLCTNNSLALMNAALGGLGIAHLPTFLAGPAMREGRLRPLLLEYTPSPQIASAVYPAAKFLAPKVRYVIDFLRQAFGGGERDPDWDAWRSTRKSR
ncbi:MAG TPA: LysR family transcriptional regulator [Rudaea sp.]|nr:LysR family transcriptional regulator [Rudaea sp.]